MSNARSTYWDTIKGILIFLVVLGHTGTALGDKLLSVIYAFHMPAFVFVSGYFSRKKPYSEYTKNVRRLIIIYLVFDAAYIALDLILGSRITTARLLSPSFALWYILCLIYWRAILQLIPDRLLSYPLFIIFGTLLLSIIAGFIPLGTQISFQRAFVFMPFFFLGYYVKQYHHIEKIRSLNKSYLILSYLILSVICYLYLPVFYCNTFYLKPGDMLMRCTQIVIALILCFAFLNFIPSKLGCFDHLGRYTLIIYLLHPPFIKCFKLVLNNLNFDVKVSGAIIISVISIALIYSIRNWKVFRWLA